MPSSRLRVYQYLPYLKQFGIDGDVRPTLPDPWFTRCYYSPSKMVHLFQYGMEALGSLKRLGESRHYDLFFIQKGLLTTNLRGWERFLSWANPDLVFDLDDAVYEASAVEFQSPFFRRFQDPGQAGKISSRARAVIVGNHYLKELTLRYNPNVFVIPTPVDTNRFRPQNGKKKEKRNEVVIGWIGVEAVLTYLRALEKILQEIAKRYPIRLKLITRLGKNPFALKGVNVDLVPWSYQSEVQEMGEFDIGIMPLKEDRWALGKCGLKLLQYMAMAIPSVSTRYGVNPEIVEEGKDGFLAREPEEWIEKLSRLIEDEALRERMGAEARRKAVEKYSLEKTAPLLAAVLEKVGRS